MVEEGHKVLVNIKSIESVKKHKISMTIDEITKSRMVGIKRTRGLKRVENVVDFLLDVYEKVIDEREYMLYTMNTLNDVMKNIDRIVAGTSRVKDVPPEEIESLKNQLVTIKSERDRFIKLVHTEYNRPRIINKELDVTYIAETNKDMGESFSLPDENKFAEQAKMKRGSSFKKITREIIKEEFESQPVEQITEEASLEDLSPFPLDEGMKQSLRKEEEENKKLSPLFIADPEPKSKKDNKNNSDTDDPF